MLFVFQGLSLLFQFSLMHYFMSSMSSVSSIQYLDLCVAYYCMAVTPLHLQTINSFSIKITLKAAHLYLFCGNTLEGTQFQSVMEEPSEIQECSLT